MSVIYTADDQKRFVFEMLREVTRLFTARNISDIAAVNGLAVLLGMYCGESKILQETAISIVKNSAGNFDKKVSLLSRILGRTR